MKGSRFLGLLFLGSTTSFVGCVHRSDSCSRNFGIYEKLFDPELATQTIRVLRRPENKSLKPVSPLPAVCSVHGTNLLSVEVPDLERTYSPSTVGPRFTALKERSFPNSLLWHPTTFVSDEKLVSITLCAECQVLLNEALETGVANLFE